MTQVMDTRKHGSDLLGSCDYLNRITEALTSV
jgi:hypothetical protein